MSEQTQSFPFGKTLEKAHMANIHQSADIMQKLCNWIEQDKNIFYFCGNVGTGKTYFCSAWYNMLKEQGKHVRAYTEYKLFAQLRSVIQKNWDPMTELERLCDAKYFILDDMGSSSNLTDWQKEMLFEFVNIRMETGLPTLITSNMCRKDIQENFHQRFESRIYAAKNTIVELNGEDRRQWKEADGQ